MSGKGVLLVSACLMALLAHQRAQAWRDDRSLWRVAAQLHPTQAEVSWRIGVLAYQAHDRPTARAQFRQARLALRDIPRAAPLTNLIWLWTDITGGE